MASIEMGARLVLLLAVCLLLRAQEASVRTSFHVKQVAAGTVYLDGGSEDGLSEGMRLHVTQLTPGDAQVNAKEIGWITIIAVASNSSACEVKEARAPLAMGQEALLSDTDAAVIKELRTSRQRRKYAQTVSFTEGDPIEAEMREYVPRPPLPEVNRARGRISFEQDAILDHAAGGLRTMQEGLIARMDFTRIGGSYWNLTGYWHGRMSSLSNSTQTTLTDLMNRTYQIGLYYNNPNSSYVAGMGRFLLPWANSLDTIDGAYFGRKLHGDVTVGMFAGSMPDPTAWNYDPSRQILGAFANIERGDYDDVHISSTAGVAVNRLHWQPERRFVFFENTLMYGQTISIHHNMEADELNPALTQGRNQGPRLARSFLTVRVQPSRIISFDVSHNYFRGVPTFDTRLIETGLLDKLLFQGLSAGFRLELPHRTSFYTSLGSSKRETDHKSALNEMIGLVLNGPSWLPFRVDTRYSRFNSSFGSGKYESISISRQIGDRLRYEFEAGQQSLRSTFSAADRARYIQTNLDWLLGNHYLLGGGWTVYRGAVQNYDQVLVNLGYRF